MIDLKSEEYNGFKIVFFKTETGIVYAGFPNNPSVVRSNSKEKSFKMIKEFIDRLPPLVRNSYKKHGRAMRALEVL